MYAEQRRNGVWELSPAAIPAGSEFSPIHQAFQNDENFPLSRAFIEASRSQQSDTTAEWFHRGFPDDLSPQLRELISRRENLEWMCHYPSWLLLRELLEIPWETRTVGTTGFVDAAQYVVFRQVGRPEDFASTITAKVSQPNGRTGWLKTLLSLFSNRSPAPRRPRQITNAEMDQLVAESRLSTGAITQITYQTPYAEYCPVFLQQTLPMLKSLGKSDEVRIVFWF